ncbi:hypothetical protein Pmani_031996 [Petrolisthes manimaculis]|uniref:B30.2/SPRY domain-containing protein n=1 Tax=Petrolisthes manimaculis TaxID=1843537 RepID=A0AAE1NSK9_9EUCA|nr:hypothetical protein Pmani_031996 [Petrolisthes manimaculis]
MFLHHSSLENLEHLEDLRSSCVMEDDLAWKWDPTPSYDVDSSVRVDSFQEIVMFGSRRGRGNSMVVVQGDRPLAQQHYHTWTISVQDLRDAEVMIGVATEDADFEKWNDRCRLGKDSQTWALSCGGSLCHNNMAVIHNCYQVQLRDHVTVHLDLLRATLMFEVNNKFLGCHFQDLPKKRNLYPVVGVVGQCNLKLMSTYSNPVSLLLISLIAHIHDSCRKAAWYNAPQGYKLPSGYSLQWGRSVGFNRSCLPPGLVNECMHQFPWFRDKHQTFRYCRQGVRALCTRINASFQVPRVVRLANPFPSFVPAPKVPSMPELLMTRQPVKRRTCHCLSNTGQEKCEHEDVFRFMKRRDISFLSDEEIFPEATKRRKKRERRKTRKTRKPR